MNHNQIKARAQRCNDQKLCFVSLHPITEGINGNTIMFHSVAGPVIVNNEYINPSRKKKEE